MGESRNSCFLCLLVPSGTPATGCAHAHGGWVFATWPPNPHSNLPRICPHRHSWASQYSNHRPDPRVSLSAEEGQAQSSLKLPVNLTAESAPQGISEAFIYHGQVRRARGVTEADGANRERGQAETQRKPTAMITVPLTYALNLHGPCHSHITTINLPLLGPACEKGLEDGWSPVSASG